MAGKLPFEKQAEALSIIHGTLDQCVENLGIPREETRPGALALWAMAARSAKTRGAASKCP